MSYKAVLIGGGDIATHYHGLLESDNMELLALIDKNPDCPARSLFWDIPFYTDYSVIFDWDIDYAIVAATASAHFVIVKDILSHGISVIVEKPIAGSLDEINALYALADENNVTLECLYHWQVMYETDWLYEHIPEYGKISEIFMDIHDDYAKDGSIRPDRLGMLGAWTDCGINALSFIDALVPLDDAKIIKNETENDTASGYPVFAYRELTAEDAIFKISVEWRKPSREKRFYLILRDGENENKIEVIHREQKILINGKTAVEWPTDDTLVDQYRKIFRHYVPDKANRETSLRLYKLLFT